MLLTHKQIEEVAQSHINRFRSMVSLAKSGTKGYRLSECEMYLDIWERTVFAARTCSVIPEDGRREIIDAIYSGEYLSEFDTEENIEFPG